MARPLSPSTEPPKQPRLIQNRQLLPFFHWSVCFGRLGWPASGRDAGLSMSFTPPLSTTLIAAPARNTQVLALVSSRAWHGACFTEDR